MATEPDPGRQARLFIAAMLPDEVLDEIARARLALEAAGAPRLRWARIGGLHITLRFLGDTPLALQPRIEQAIAETAADTTPLDLRLGGYGLLGGGRPRLLWVGLEGAVDPLAGAARRLNAALQAHGLPPEDRALRPHLTLARVPRDARDEDAAALRAAVADAPAPKPLAFRVAELHLVRSHLGRGGARYESLTISACAGA